MTPQEDARVLLALQPYAVEARYEEGPFPLPVSRIEILAAIDRFRDCVLSVLASLEGVVYTHVLIRGPSGVRSPADLL